MRISEKNIDRLCIGAMIGGLLLAGLIALLPALGHATTPVSSAIPIARQVLQDGLNDPGRARFRHVTVRVDQRGVPFVCGEVNAPNVYGGMAGWQPFSVNTARSHALFGFDEAANTAVRSICGDATVPTDGRDYTAQLKLQ